MDRVAAERLGETTRVGSFEIIRKLARGGMAELYLARGPEGVAVVKKILPRYTNSPRMIQLFLDEARLAQSLDHPNIVRAYEAGHDHLGTAYFAMEYLHGQDVRTVLHRAWTIGEQVPIEHAVYIALNVAAALHYAHERRREDGALLEIVHRDVSPSNVVVSYDGAVKLLDFGVAKAATSSVKTRTGTLKGKISYMSPEQARGMKLDRRSDIFSLGIVLWELVTTQRLFRGENDLQTLQLIINEPPRRPSELQPACTPELERVILRALSQDLGQRYPTAAELLRDLEEVARAQQLALGPDGLAEYLGYLFGAELRSWHEARAGGKTLLEHLTSVNELTIQLTESDFIEAFDLEAMIAEEEEDDASEVSEHTDMPTRPEPAIAASGSIRPSGARQATPVAPLPAVRPQAPPMPGARAATPAIPAPIVQPPVVAVADAAPSAQSGPWSIARGSSAATPSAGAITVAPPPTAAPASFPQGGFALDPARADRLLRRGLWVVAALAAGIVVFSIIMSVVAGP